MPTAVAAARARRRLCHGSGGGVCEPEASARLGPSAPAAARLHSPALSAAAMAWEEAEAAASEAAAARAFSRLLYSRVRWGRVRWT